MDNKVKLVRKSSMKFRACTKEFLELPQYIFVCAG